MPGWINEIPDLTPEPLPGIRRGAFDNTAEDVALGRCMVWLFSRGSDYPFTIEGALAIARYHTMSRPEQRAMNYIVHSSGKGSREHCTEWLTAYREDAEQ